MFELGSKYLIDNNLLIHELQLGESLNHCLHSERRADFSLMLAMLVDDAREFSQFKTPNTEVETSETTEQSLRRQFDLPKAKPLALNHLSEIVQFNEAKKANTGMLTDIKLSESLSPKALCFRDDKLFIPTNVKNNTSLYCQSKLKRQADHAPDRLDFNANEWLKTIAATRAKSLITTA